MSLLLQFEKKFKFYLKLHFQFTLLPLLLDGAELI